jgi:signal transduction histidine kinase
VRSDGAKHLAIAEVSDTGPGIPMEMQRQIFDPFYTTKTDGTGLGLSVSYAIVSDHHGEIQVESEPGSGTVFKILLPLASEE